MRKKIIGVMGPGKEATNKDIENAIILGKLIAENDWITLSGGTINGVMNAVSQGAKERGGLVVGILPSDDESTFSKYLDIPIVTNMRSGRNYINILSSDLVIACGMGPGTASEVSLALTNSKKNVILLNCEKLSNDFFKNMNQEIVHVANNPNEAIELVKKILS